jgi:hypothetical protein
VSAILRSAGLDDFAALGVDEPVEGAPCDAVLPHPPLAIELVGEGADAVPFRNVVAA